VCLTIKLLRRSAWAVPLAFIAVFEFGLTVNTVAAKPTQGQQPVTEVDWAVAAAIGLFGFNSGAALATVVGVLIEVPVMLLIVRVVNNTRGWYESGSRASRHHPRDPMTYSGNPPGLPRR
jgi:hypothetical protein